MNKTLPIIVFVSLLLMCLSITLLCYIQSNNIKQILKYIIMINLLSFLLFFIVGFIYEIVKQISFIMKGDNYALRTK